MDLPAADLQDDCFFGSDDFSSISWSIFLDERSACAQFFGPALRLCTPVGSVGRLANRLHLGGRAKGVSAEWVQVQALAHSTQQSDICEAPLRGQGVFGPFSRLFTAGFFCFICGGDLGPGIDNSNFQIDDDQLRYFKDPTEKSPSAWLMLGLASTARPRTW